MTATASDTAGSSRRGALFGPERRAVTIGIVLLISMVAFENMGVSTAMPALVSDLGSTDLYAWPFVTFVAANVVGTVVGGAWSDAHGPRTVLRASPLLFGAGLLVAGTAGTFAQLLAGRVLQGLGAGAVGVGVYVLVARVYPAVLRPAVFGLISSAWVLPALIGPPVSGTVTDAFSWHWVFLGLLPLVVVATLLVTPATRDLGPTDDAREPGRRMLPAALLAAFGVAALSWAGHASGLVAVVVGLASLAVLAPALVRLTPPGTFRARRGVPAVIVSRGLVSGSFFAVASFLPLMLTSVHGWSLTAAGLPLIAGSLGWSASAAWQGRHPDLSRPVLLRVGFVMVGLAIAGLLTVTPTGGTGWLALPVWTVGGLGMGLAFSSISYLLLQGSEPGEVGYHSSAAQLTDGLAQAVTVGAGGTLLAVTSSTSVGLSWLLVAMALLAAIGVLVSPRTRSGASTAAAPR